jgi:flagellar protein FlbD
MIRVTRLDNTEIVINAELIETIEEAPDTIISTTTKKRFLVKESANTVVEKILRYRRFVMSGSDESISNGKIKEFF